MVIKEVSETDDRDAWMQHQFLRQVPRETKIMSLLDQAHCHAIPRLYGYKRYPHVCKHRMYMEFCPYDDLWNLCNRYRNAGFVISGFPFVQPLS